MEKTKKSTVKAAAPVSANAIKAAYQQHLLNTGNRPPSIYKFALDLGIREDEFYAFFGSFDGVEKSIWNDYIHKTIVRLQNDESFSTFSSREKILSLYFTLLEELKAHRSFILLQLEQVKQFEANPLFLHDFRKTFEEFVELILAQGKQSGEIATRPLLDDRYARLFWLHMGFILNFWKKDDTAGFERTDAAVEKSVNLAFDLISKGAVDSAIDFGKFLFQTR